MTESKALENLKYAHACDVALDLTSQEVHELWGEIEKLKAENAQLQRSTNDETVPEKFFENLDKLRDMLGERFTDENPNDFFDNLRKGA